MPRILRRLALAAGPTSFFNCIISAGDAHQFCLMQRKAILISGRSGIVISCAAFKMEVQMAWKAPKIVEVSVGMEINMYACATRK